MASGDIISQAELDSLLSSLETGAGRGVGARAPRSLGEGRSTATPLRKRHGATAVHEARVHDFARGEALSRSTLQALESLYGAFAITAAARLSTYLRARCRIALLSVDQLTYQQFKRSVPDPTVIGLLDLVHLPGQAILEINQSVGLWIIDHILGGEGEAPKLARPLTDVEKVLVEGALSNLVSELRIAFPGLPEATAALAHVLHSAEAAAIAEPAEPVVVASFEITLDNLTGMASICIPADSLRPAADAQSRGDSAEQTAVWWAAADESAVAASLMRLRIPCRVRLGTASVSAAHLASIAVGDVICLDRPLSGAMEFLVAGRPKFNCHPVAAGTKLAVEITR